MAMEHDLKIIPVLNKIDLPVADPERVTGEVIKMLGCKKEDIFRISAKEGTGVEKVLDAVIQKIPAPSLTPPPPSPNGRGGGSERKKSGAYFRCGDGRVSRCGHLCAGRRRPV